MCARLKKTISANEEREQQVADLIARPTIVRGQPSTDGEWITYFDVEGRIAINGQDIRYNL